MKKYTLPLIIAVLIIISIIINQTSSTPEAKLVNKLNSELEQDCFLYEKESDIYADASDKEYPTVYDREYIEVSYLDNATVTGTHNILPAEKDSNRATFIGVTQDGFLNVVATANAEGETWKEQRIYKVEDDKLFVGYQPVYVPQYKDDNGVYMYEDLNKIVFDTPEFFLEKVTCDAENSDEL